MKDVYQHYNPFRRPDWRWERVLSLVDRDPKGRTTKRDDNYVKQARVFITAWRGRSESRRRAMFYENPGLHLAYQMYEQESEEVDNALFLQGRLLAGMEYKVIADVMQTVPQMVEWYEALFFNVRDRMHARDWINKQVLMPAMSRNFGLFSPANSGQQPAPWQQQIIVRPFMDASLKMFAYYGGPVLCEFLIAGFQQGKMCQSPDSLADWLDGHWAMTVRARSAQAARTFEINKYNIMELFATHAKIMEIEKSSDSAEQKRNTLEQHINALVGEMKNVWSVGDDNEALEGTDVPKYDVGAAELRNDELMLVAAGQKLKQDALDQLALPAPTPKNK